MYMCVCMCVCDYMLRTYIIYGVIVLSTRPIFSIFYLWSLAHKTNGVMCACMRVHARSYGNEMHNLSCPWFSNQLGASIKPINASILLAMHTLNQTILRFCPMQLCVHCVN